MKILLLGKNGQVGWELQRTLTLLGEIIALGRQDLDLTDQQTTRNTIRHIKPDLIVNAAAYTAVDKAEEEAELAMAINGTAPGILAEEAALLKATLVHYSTDYVFDGTKNQPYTEQDIPNPVNIYGKTKLAGEEAISQTEIPHLILRISWVYGTRRNNFLTAMLKLFEKKQELRVVNDQFGSPTWCRLIAEATALVLAQNQYFKKKNQGIYHLSASSDTTWYDFAINILELYKAELQHLPLIRPIKTEDYPALAARPRYSLLGGNKMFDKYNIQLPTWHEQLKLALSSII